MISVWPFKEAPGFIKELSNHGGDEDWAAVVDRWDCDDATDEWPRGDDNDPYYLPSWMWPGTGFGACRVRVYRTPGAEDVSVVVIGAHA